MVLFSLSVFCTLLLGSDKGKKEVSPEPGPEKIRSSNISIRMVLVVVFYNALIVN